ncbi:MAG: hypothetical protein PHU23_02520 [Dehalococcoidales bacterium]|nr:hypothetical protein [Dehalococcoidales bacterium]
MIVRGQQLSQEYAYPVLNIGDRLREMKKVLSDFEKKDIANRIWHKDHTVWKPGPEQISNRLGWLQSPDWAADRISEMESFAREVKEAGYHHVVLLGMGGSSLGPEVMRKTFGSGVNYPQLIVLDSTHPAWVESVVRSIEPGHTLYLVSSKSGTTIETMCLYRYFRHMVEEEMGKPEAGRNFAAITDEDTPLAHLAEKEGFRRCFINPDDIGGRYSVLSYFGLVPAALTGIDIRRLIERAAYMQESCAPCADAGANPGLWLGALIGSCALHGRNKLTFIISPSVSVFGLWVEQLLAESTGKEGKGILPVIGEPLVRPELYGDDRLFVYLRMKGDNIRRTDEAVMKLEVAGQPIIQIEIGDQYDLGAEFFRWEFATAVAGIVLGINPSDQPDVQTAKDATKQIIKGYKDSQSFPEIPPGAFLKEWLEQAGPDNYIAILAYLNQTPAVERAFFDFRKRLLERYRMATTLGYGPGYLHSTGQIHKGGPNNGLYIQVAAARIRDLPLPGEHFSFGILTEAEALGDYRALETRGRKVFRLELCSGSGAAIARAVKDL